MGFYLNVTVTDKSCTEGLKFNRVLYWKELFWVSIFLEVKDDNIRQTAVGALIPALNVKEVKKELFKKKSEIRTTTLFFRNKEMSFKIMQITQIKFSFKS